MIDCIYLGSNTGEMIEVRRIRRKNKAIIKFPIYQCSILDICQPHYRCDKKTISETYDETEPWPTPCVKCKYRKINSDA